MAQAWRRWRKRGGDGASEEASGGLSEMAGAFAAGLAVAEVEAGAAGEGARLEEGAVARGDRGVERGGRGVARERVGVEQCDVFLGEAGVAGFFRRAQREEEFDDFALAARALEEVLQAVARLHAVEVGIEARRQGEEPALDGDRLLPIELGQAEALEARGAFIRISRGDVRRIAVAALHYIGFARAMVAGELLRLALLVEVVEEAGVDGLAGRGDAAGSAAAPAGRAG